MEEVEKVNSPIPCQRKEGEGCCLSPWLMSSSAEDQPRAARPCWRAWKELGQDRDISAAASHNFSVENCFTQIIVTGTDEWKISKKEMCQIHGC